MRKKTLYPVITAFLGLFTVMTSAVSTFAWMITSRKATATINNVRIDGMNAELDSLNIIKFDYSYTKVGDLVMYDYLTPETGEVNSYHFYDEENAFYRLEDEDKVYCDVMNLYDPLELIINGTELITSNCNVIYEVTLSVDETGYVNLNALSELFSKVKADDQFFASDYMDFDLFFETDLNDPSLVSGDVKNYYPSYLDQATHVMGATEELYYKFSYLASNRTHINFYTDEVSSIDLGNKNCQISPEGKVKAYINVNYSKDRLEKYATELTFNAVDLIYDYLFVFKVQASNGGD